MAGLTPRPAARADARGIVGLRDGLARWQQRARIRQWEAGELPVHVAEKQVANGEWWVLDDHIGPIAGLVRLVWSDPAIWDDLVRPDAEDGGYIHGLMVARSHAGLGVGAQLVAWAEHRIEANGRTYARLDCGAENGRLRAYYRSLGFAERAERTFDGPWGTLMRFEKTLAHAATLG